MFFEERIKSIKEGYRVLEIGPGATPHPRSDVFLEMEFETKEELIAQSGHVGVLETEKQVVYYKGDVFPFEDKAFDYVICSHVLEHVQDVDKFLSEIFRVGKMGYLEFPTIYYDYMLNIEEHLNMLWYKDGVINWCKKTATPIPNLTEFTTFFRELQHKGFRFQNEVNQYLHQGFEWFEAVPNKEVNDYRLLTHSKSAVEDLIQPVQQKPYEHQIYGVSYTFKHLLKEIKFKFKKK